MDETVTRCPRCDSPDPRRHPAMQFEGEVQPCPHPWHRDRDTDKYPLTDVEREIAAREADKDG